MFSEYIRADIVKSNFDEWEHLCSLLVHNGLQKIKWAMDFYMIVDKGSCIPDIFHTHEHKRNIYIIFKIHT